MVFPPSSFLKNQRKNKQIIVNMKNKGSMYNTPCNVNDFWFIPYKFFL